MKKILKRKALIAFLLSFILGALIIVPQIIKGHGIYNLIADFNAQQIPFNKIINNSIKEGSFFWIWYNELGSNFISTFSFYNLFSPFNIIGYIFPASWFEYLVGPIFILKYAVAGLTSYLFIQRYVKNKNYAILGSLLYSFSGFQLTNTLFYHFHDVVALFPLLLYSLDKLVYDNKKFAFGISVALLAFTNWFFFIGQVVFVILYYIIKISTKSYKFDLKKLINIAFEAIIGVGLAAFVLLPSLLFTMSNPRVSNSWTITSMLRYNFQNYLEILRAFIFPSQIMSSRAMFASSNYSSTEFFLPFVGIILSVSYFFKKPKNWDSIFMLILGIFIFVPLLNSSFFAFTSTYYSRWFYMPILVLALTSAKCLDKKYSFKNGIIINIIMISIFVVGCYIYINKINPGQIIFDKNYTLIIIFVTLLCLSGLLFVDGIKSNGKKFKCLMIFIIIYIILWGNYNTYKYKSVSNESIDSYKNYLYVNDDLKFKKLTRTNSSESCPYNYGFLTKTSNIKSFNSNINGSSFEFYNSINYDRAVATIIKTSDKKLNDFLGVEYVISCGDDLSKEGYDLDKKIKNYSIYINKDVKKQGFAVDKYVLDDDFNRLNYNEKIDALNNSVVLNKDQINKYKDLFNKKTKYEKYEFNYINNGMESKIVSTNDTLAIYTVPYDTGWTAYVNGKKTKIEEVDNGFMAIKINEGENNIEFKYFPPGLLGGIIISCISLLIFVIYVILYMKESRCKNEKK